MTQKSVKRDIKSKQFQFLAESFKTWMETLGYKPETIKLNHRNIQEFMAHLETQSITKLKDFENKHANLFIEYLQHRPNQSKSGSLKASFINKYITALRLFSKYLQQSGKANITIKPELLKTIETATFLSKNEINQLYKAAKEEPNAYNLRDTAMLSIKKEKLWTSYFTAFYCYTPFARWYAFRKHCIVPWS